MSLNPYETPKSELDVKAENDSSIHLSRFSAWGVFGLSMITLGFYPIYWLITRTQTINNHYEKKINIAWLYALVGTFFLSFAIEFVEPGQWQQMAYIAVNIGYIFTYVVSLFSVRNRLSEKMNQHGDVQYKVGPVLTFFFSAIYLQYKINKYIDDQMRNDMLA